MTSKNDITGDLIKSKNNNSLYQEGWDRIFGKQKISKPEKVGFKIDSDIFSDEFVNKYEHDKNISDMLANNSNSGGFFDKKYETNE